jgi:N-acetylglucosaminyldiphosphoundecaprenol N-acetyl-beta-D-mannosaminyltransferase
MQSIDAATTVPAADISFDVASGVPDATHHAPAGGERDDLSRHVYCLLGLAIDALEMPEAVRRVEAATREPKPFLISTVNVNFLTSSLTDNEFRESVLRSALSLADGMPVVWIARILGLPIRNRVAGSDMFVALSAAKGPAQPLSVCLFGGAAGVATAAAKALNDSPGRLRCVGAFCPGFGSVEELSRGPIIDEINASSADILVVALGATKGQRWLLRNHNRLLPPVRSHLGAVVNFAAGTVKRAPPILHKLGLEWLWRIKEEPHLWRRYWRDGICIVRLVVTRILPLAFISRSQKATASRRHFAIGQADNSDATIVQLSGYATERHVTEAIGPFRRALAVNKDIVIDLAEAVFIDCRFLGLLLMLRKQLEESGKSLKFIGITPPLTRLFRLNGVEFLFL